MPASTVSPHQFQKVASLLLLFGFKQFKIARERTQSHGVRYSLDRSAIDSAADNCLTWRPQHTCERLGRRIRGRRAGRGDIVATMSFYWCLMDFGNDSGDFK